MKRIDRIMDAAIWAAAGLIIGAILAQSMKGCAPGGSRAAATLGTPAQSPTSQGVGPAGLEIETGGCGTESTDASDCDLCGYASRRKRFLPAGQPPVLDIAPAGILFDFFSPMADDVIGVGDGNKTPKAETKADQGRRALLRPSSTPNPVGLFRGLEKAMAREIPLTQGQVALVDETDYDWLKQWKWYASKRHYTWYALRVRHKSEGPGPDRIYMHRLILGEPDGLEVDHKDGNGLNNQRENLRRATHALNNKNCHHVAHKTSGLPMGVCRVREKYKAQIYQDGRNIYLGLFDTPVDAEKAYLEARKESISLAEEAITAPPTPLQAVAPTFPSGVRKALDLLRMHESSNGKRMVGDCGRAQGWLQQHRDHWRVGCEVLGVAWPWPADTRDLAKCEAIAAGNWTRYCPDALARGDVEMLVRSHRLPSAPHRADNDAYWAKVKGN